MTRDPWIKKAKWLTQALIISGTLNVGLLCTFLYTALTDSKSTLSVADTSSKKSIKIDEKLSMNELIDTYQRQTFQDLLLYLNNTNHIESGYTCRDIALGCLVTFHHFNLERALGGITLQKRAIPMDQGQTLTIFPGLADYQYQAIVHYAKTEKWPLTSEGLYRELQKQKAPFDPSLVEAFYLSPEFHFINMLFTKTGINLKKEHTVALLTQSNWGTITETYEHLQTNSDFTIEERRRFLLELFHQQSTLAAKILLETDQEYCLKQLDNTQVLQLCSLLEDRAPPAFLRALLKSPRSDEIWKKASSILYAQAAEETPENLDLETSKRRFLELKTTPPPSSSKKVYKVVSGDSLWKIAREHSTTVKQLREINELKTDQLKVGQTLKIP